jgi:hypothetical protein
MPDRNLLRGALPAALLASLLLSHSFPGLAAAPSLAEAPAQSPPIAAGAPLPPAVLEALQQLSFPPDQPVGFAQHQSSPMFKRSVSSRGQLWRETGGALLMQVAHPVPELRRIDGQTLTIRRPSKARETVQPLPASAFDRVRHQLTLNDRKPGDLLLLAASALLNGNFKWIEAHFHGHLGEAPESVVLSPKRPAVRKSLPRLTLIIAADQLRSLRADRGGRGTQQFDFSPLPP